MKLTDPIPGAKFDRVTYLLMAAGAVLLLISMVLKLAGVGAYEEFGLLGIALALIGSQIDQTVALDAHVDDLAIAANKKLQPGEPRRRVGTAPWAWYALAIVSIVAGLLLVSTFLSGS